MSSILLLGFMGSGKSAVARQLARALKRHLIDLDAEIETMVGTTIAKYFVSHGEEAFRNAESSVLRAACIQEAVVSLGGGAPNRAVNREILKNAAREGALVVYLQTSSRELATRIRRAPGKRPLIDGDGQLDFEGTLRRVEELMAEREAFYRECANFVIKTDGLSIAQVAREIEREVQFSIHEPDDAQEDDPLEDQDEDQPHEPDDSSDQNLQIKAQPTLL